MKSKKPLSSQDLTLDNSNIRSVRQPNRLVYRYSREAWLEGQQIKPRKEWSQKDRHEHTTDGVSTIKSNAVMNGPGVLLRVHVRIVPWSKCIILSRWSTRCVLEVKYQGVFVSCDWFIPLLAHLQETMNYCHPRGSPSERSPHLARDEPRSQPKTVNGANPRSKSRLPPVLALGPHGIPRSNRTHWWLESEVKIVHEKTKFKNTSSPRQKFQPFFSMTAATSAAAISTISPVKPCWISITLLFSRRNTRPKSEK